MYIRRRRVYRNPLQLDLFAWEHPATSPLPLPYAVQMLSRRYRLRPPIARVVAEAMGFDAEARR